jgi:hypothetical protein
MILVLTLRLLIMLLEGTDPSRYDPARLPKPEKRGPGREKDSQGR